MSRSGLEIDRDTGNIIREGCGSCIVKVWHKSNPHTGKGGHFTEPITEPKESDDEKAQNKTKKKERASRQS